MKEAFAEDERVRIACLSPPSSPSSSSSSSLLSTPASSPPSSPPPSPLHFPLCSPSSLWSSTQGHIYEAGAVVLLPSKEVIGNREEIRDIKSKEPLSVHGYNHPAVIIDSPWYQDSTEVVNIAICSSHPIDRQHAFQLADGPAPRGISGRHGDILYVQKSHIQKGTNVQTRCLYTVPTSYFKQWYGGIAILSPASLENLRDKIRDGSVNEKSRSKMANNSWRQSPPGFKPTVSSSGWSTTNRDKRIRERNDNLNLGFNKRRRSNTSFESWRQNSS